MKTFIGILLVGFLGFLGCSGSDGGTSTTSTTVGEAIPLAPLGITNTTTTAFEWIPVQGATRYHLLVEDIREETQFAEWYTPEEGQCASGDDLLCTVTPDIEILGDTWKVMACDGDQCGPWSRSLQFGFAVQDPPEERFTVHGDDTVTDNKTALMWSQNADRPGGPLHWTEAVDFCETLILGDWTDWRLPRPSEIKSLIDPSRTEPALPDWNPFWWVKYSYRQYYWTNEGITSRHECYEWWEDPEHFYAPRCVDWRTDYITCSADFGRGIVWCLPGAQDPGYYAWCVRDPTP
jgi:hypothetical protein